MYELRLRENLPRVREAIEEATSRVGRREGEVTLVAVTKAHPPAALSAALSVGLTDLGENRLEEMEEKVGLLGRDAATWHMVGHLQSRKARSAVGVADLIHSVDTLKLGRRLSSFSEEEGRASMLRYARQLGEALNRYGAPRCQADILRPGGRGPGGRPPGGPGRPR